MKKFSFVLVLLLMATALFAAGGQEGTSAGGLEPVVIKSMMFGEKPIQMDVVLEEFYKRTQDTLNITLDIEFNAVPDHKQKLLLRMTAGEEMDMVFDAPWVHIRTLAKDGAYLDIEPYFHNAEYPGLAKSFSKDYLDANKFYDVLYGMPVTISVASTEGWLIRKDIMTKYGYDEILEWDVLEEFLDKAVAGEGLVGVGAEGRTGFFRSFMQEPELYEYDVFLQDSFWVALSADHKTIEAVSYGPSGTWSGDTVNIEDFPSPWNTTAKWSERDLTFKAWNRFLEPDVMSQTDGEALFTAGKSIAQMRGMGSSNRMLPQLKQIVPEAEIYSFPFDRGVRYQIPGSKYTNYKVWNFVCLPVTGKNPDRVMSFLDWIFQSPENHDLIELGIEGVHWEAGTGNSYSRLGAAEEQYVFPWYQLTGLPGLSRGPADISDSEKAYDAWEADSTRYKTHPFTGFTFDQSSVKSAKAKVDAIYAEIAVGINNGAFDDPVAVKTKAFEDAMGAGLDEIQAEFLKQAQDFLNSK